MMSEKRSKSIWSSDPRNTAWSQDTNNFGYRMLNKMGWSAGKGLGVKEDGENSHIKIKVKSNNLGVGANLNNCSDWTKQQDDFSMLLSNLNNVHSQTAADDKVTNNNLFKMAELNGKKAKYHKRLKCKDVKNYSETDLTCIFGKSQSSPELSTLTTKTDSLNTSDDKAFGVKTISSQMNLKEYFASKHQSNADNPRKKSKLMTCEEESTSDIECRPVSFRLGDDDDESDSSLSKSKRNKKNKKESNDNTCKTKKSSKKRKRKEKKKTKKLKNSSK